METNSKECIIDIVNMRSIKVYHKKFNSSMIKIKINETGFFIAQIKIEKSRKVIKIVIHN